MENFASSFFEQEPEFMTNDDGGGGGGSDADWPSTWGTYNNNNTNKTSKVKTTPTMSNKAKTSNMNDMTFNPFVLSQEEDKEVERLDESHGRNRSGSHSKNNSSSSNGAELRLSPWRVDLDDSALVEDSVNTSNTSTCKQQRMNPPWRVDLDDTVENESDQDDDEEKDDNVNANEKNEGKDHSNHCSSSQNRSANIIKRISKEKNDVTSITASPATPTGVVESPTNPWRFVDRAGGSHTFQDKENKEDDDDGDDSTDMTGPLYHSEDHHHHHHGKSSSVVSTPATENCSTLDPWIELVSVNEDSVSGIAAPTTPFRASYSKQKQQQRPQAMSEEEGRDDSGSSGEDNVRGGSSSTKNITVTIGSSSCMATSPITMEAKTTTTLVSPHAASNASSSSSGKRATGHNTPPPPSQHHHQHAVEYCDSFGFAPSVAAFGDTSSMNVTGGGRDRNGTTTFGEATLFGGHPRSCRTPPPLEDYDELQYSYVVGDDESTARDSLCGRDEESTAAHAVSSVAAQDEDDDQNQDTTTTPPSFVKRRFINVNNKMATGREESFKKKEEEDKKEHMREVQILAEDDGAYEVQATYSRVFPPVEQDTGTVTATSAVDTDAAAADVHTESISVDDPSLLVIESADEEDEEDQHELDHAGSRSQCPVLFEETTSSSHNAHESSGSCTDPASGSRSSDSRCNGLSWTADSHSTSSCNSATSLEQSKHWITAIVADELWSDNVQVVEEAIGTLHKILLRSILLVPRGNDTTITKSTSHSGITESMSSHSESVSPEQGYQTKTANSSNKSNNNERNELIELAFCRGCPLAVVRAMKAHPTNAFLQDSGLCILNVFCWTGVASHVVEVGSLERAMAAVGQSKYMESEKDKANESNRHSISPMSKNNVGRNVKAHEVVESAIYHIANLLRDKTLAARVIDDGGLQAIVTAMKRLSNQADVQLAGCCAFRNLLQHQKRIILGRQWANKVVKVGAIDRVIAALDDHPSNEKLQQEGYKILQRLSKLNDDRQDISNEEHDQKEKESVSYYRTKSIDASGFFSPSF